MNAVEERGERVIFAVEVSVPFSQSAAFAEALTGNDDDIILAAEHAVRARIAEVDIRHDLTGEEVELAIVREDIVRPFLADAMYGR